jgi:hypothetical protein
MYSAGAGQKHMYMAVVIEGSRLLPGSLATRRGCSSLSAPKTAGCGGRDGPDWLGHGVHAWW